MYNRTLMYFEMRVSETPDGKRIYSPQAISSRVTEYALRKELSDYAERACNAHEALVERLERAGKMLKQIQHGYTGPAGAIIYSEIAAIDEALAAAKGE